MTAQFMHASGAHNPYPHGPIVGGRARSILTVHRRRRRQAVKQQVASIRRQIAEQVATMRPVQTKPLTEMTRDELRAAAKDRGLTGYGRLNKAGLLHLLGVES